MRAPENEFQRINSLKSIVGRRVPANAGKLVRCGRDYAEPVTVLPDGRTSDDSDAPLALQNGLFRGYGALARSSKSRCAKRD